MRGPFGPAGPYLDALFCKLINVFFVNEFHRMIYRRGMWTCFDALAHSEGIGMRLIISVWPKSIHFDFNYFGLKILRRKRTNRSSPIETVFFCGDLTQPNPLDSSAESIKWHLREKPFLCVELTVELMLAKWQILLTLTPSSSAEKKIVSFG